MTRMPRLASAVLALLFAAATAPRACADPGDRSDGSGADQPPPQHLESLVPELAEHPYAMKPGPREFAHRMSFSPSYGMLGTDPLFNFRLAFNPSNWMGWEASLAHAPGQSVHAVLHSLSLIARKPMASRLQPYLAAGYGMMIVFPGQSTNAVSVTRNALVGGGGVEFYIRNDLALRGDVRGASVIGAQRDREGIVAYNYFQGTIGLAFYRSIRP